MSIAENTVIFSVTNGKKDYPQVGALWSQFLDKLNISNYIVYCLDKESFNYLNEKGVKCQFVKKKPQIEDRYLGEGAAGLDKRFGLIGAYKCMIAKDLLKQGKNIVFADTDAFFCRDPMPHISQLLDQYDCLLSTAVLGCSHPQETLKEIGFTACSGFFALKAGKRSIDFISGMESRLTEYGDLQRAINFYLLPYIQQLGLPLSERREAAFRIEDLHIKLLPQSLVRRAGRVARDKKWNLDVSHVPPCVFHVMWRCHEKGVDLYKKLYG
tara:strand:- start:4063 stop:4869 length:807 start_codon:yes stop_codon:yes gene_type:complete